MSDSNYQPSLGTRVRWVFIVVTVILIVFLVVNGLAD